MSFFSDIEGIFDPGGDPAAIHRAAGACRTLAASVREVDAALDSIAKGLQKSWRGAGGSEEQSAAAAFQKAWVKFSTAMLDYARGLEQTAGKLDQVADEIQSAQQQAAHLKEVALAALAVGAGLTFFTFGISDAAAEASAMADVAVATGLMSSLDAMLADAAAILDGLMSAFIQVAARFAMGAGFSLAAEMISKLAFNHENPLDPANYSANDISNILLGGMITAGMGEVISNSARLSGFMDAHPIIGTAASGGTGGLLGSAISQFAIQGKKFDASTLEAVGAGTALSALSGGLIGKAGTMGGPIGRIFNENPAAGDNSPVAVPELSIAGGGLDAPVPDPAVPETAPVPADPAASGTAVGSAPAEPLPPVPDPAAPAQSASSAAGPPASPEPVPPGADPAAPAASPSPAAGPAAPAESASPAPAAPAPPAAGPAAPAEPPPPVPPAAPDGPGPIARAFAKAGAITGISKGDVIRGSVGLPVSVIKNEFFSGSHPSGPAIPPAPPPPPSAPVPHVAPPLAPHPPPPVPPGPPPVPPGPPPVPPHIGGGTVTVRPGDSLYQIAGQRLGNPNLYPLIQAANPQAVGPNGVIMPGQVLHIPRLPAVPADVTAQVVRPGDSVWEIAGGNPALVQRIAELNHLADPSLIQPGQVLLIPEAAL